MQLKREQGELRDGGGYETKGAERWEGQSEKKERRDMRGKRGERERKREK